MAPRDVQPIKVRSIEGAHPGSPQFEVVFGHRRHQACLELGIPVQAVVDPGMKDVDLFVEMERENREREDLSVWEQGVMYMRALEQGLFPSAKQLAAAIDRDLGNIGKAMALAKLPGEVVRAFGSPLNLQFRWATALKDAHQRDPEGLLAAAREIAAKVPAATPAEVFAALTEQGRAGRPGEASSTEWKDDDGKRIASLTIDRKGRATVSFDQPLDEGQRRKLNQGRRRVPGAKGVVRAVVSREQWEERSARGRPTHPIQVSANTLNCNADIADLTASGTCIFPSSRNCNQINDLKRVSRK